MIVEVLAAVFVIVFCYYVQLYFRTLVKFQAFRGPHPLPIIGNCYNPKVASLFRYIASLRKEFGKVFVMHLFTKAYLVVLEPTIVRRVLSDSTSFTKGTDYSKIFAVVFGEGLVTSSHDKHKNDRSIFNKYFIRSNVAKSAKMYNSVTKHAIDQLLDEKMGDKNELQINIEHFFARLALRIFMNFCCGTDYRQNLSREEEICDIVSEASCAVGKMIMFSAPIFSFIPWVKQAEKCRAEVWKDIQTIIVDRKKAIAAGEEPADDCITAMLNNNMSEKDMIDHAVTLICAGHDTTAFFSSYVCLLLAENPDCQEKLREDIVALLGDSNDISADDISKLTYLHQVMEETLRLFAIIPCLTRVATKEVTIKDAASDTPGGALRDVTIPKGADVMIPMYLLNREPTVWENPSKFDPSRFDGHGDYTSAKSGFFPFGYGARTCIGNTLAQLETSVFICHLLRRFRFKTVPGFKININAGISLTTSNGVHLIAERLH